MKSKNTWEFSSSPGALVNPQALTEMDPSAFMKTARMAPSPCAHADVISGVPVSRPEHSIITIWATMEMMAGKGSRH